MTTDPNWLEILSESYTQEVSQSARNLQEEADQMFNLIETIETALDVDLTESQVDALISALSESQRTSRVARSATKRFGPSSQDPRYRLALARHDHDEIRRGPRILSRAERMADEVYQKDAEKIADKNDGDDYRTTRRNQKPLPPGATHADWQRQQDELEPVNVAANAGARRRAVAASTANPLLVLARRNNRLKLVTDIAQDLIGARAGGNRHHNPALDRYYNNQTGEQPGDYINDPPVFDIPDEGHVERKGLKFSTGAIRTPKKNRNRKKD